MSLWHLHHQLSKNVFSLRRKITVKDFFLFSLAELLILTITITLVLNYTTDPVLNAVIPMVVFMGITIFFIVDRYRELEVQSGMLRISHWGKPKLEIKKENTADIEVNFGLNFKPSIFDLHHHYTHYINIIFTLRNGKKINKYQLNNVHFLDFKQLLAHHQYPIITESGWNKFDDKK
ncbi:MAG: hypothetical protein HYT15_04155 [Candidatus Magasanikbacteria bacterium]|nr:hypothetical protein [Candidatus Magasanikbacteria bacterium]